MTQTQNDHALHIYPDDTTLATRVATFLAPAFGDGAAVLSVGTRAHVAAIEQRLRTDGHDVDGARAAGRYVTLDAERTVPLLLRHGMPTAESFEEIVGVHVARLAREHGNVRAFGELVSLLWRDGKRSAALRLEELWNEALGYHPLALLCGYAQRAVGHAGGEAASPIVRAHTRLL